MMLFLGMIVLQILLESLPISSSGHSALVAAGMQMLQVHTDRCQGIAHSFFGGSPGVVALLNHVMHVPTVLILAFFFFSRWWIFVRHPRRTWRMAAKLIGYCAVSCTVTAAWYLFFMIFGQPPMPLWLGFAATAVLLFCTSHIVVSHARISLPLMVALGAVQGLALMPGLSRFAVTYVCALWFGCAPRKAFELCFAIQWPLIFVGSLHAAYKLHVLGYDLTAYLFTPYALALFVAACSSYALLCLSWYLARTQKLFYVGWYMLLPTVVALALSIFC